MRESALWRVLYRSWSDCYLRARAHAATHERAHNIESICLKARRPQSSLLMLERRTIFQFKSSQCLPDVCTLALALFNNGHVTIWNLIINPLLLHWRTLKNRPWSSTLFWQYSNSKNENKNIQYIVFRTIYPTNIVVLRISNMLYYVSIQ